MNRLLSELRRRNVFRVAAAYLVASWLVLQIVVAIKTSASLPAWTDGMALVVLVIGFPIAVIITWAFELTPEGFKPTETSERAGGIRPMAAGDYALLALLVLVLGMASFQVFRPNATPAPEQAAEDVETVALAKPAPSANSIAVLPFADLSPDGDQEYFSDGIAEEILNVLVRVDGLDVTSRTSAFQFKGQEIGLPQIASELNVRFILEGSVRRAGATVRITAQLIDSVGDRHLWSQTYDRPLSTQNLFSIQDEIANAIVDRIGSALGISRASEITVPVTTNDVGAYDLFLQARPIFQARGKLDQVDELLARATELDPNYADAWAMRAVLQTLLVAYNYSDRTRAEIGALANEFAGRALAIDGRNSLALTALAEMEFFTAWEAQEPVDWQGVLDMYDEAIAADPHNATALLWRGLVKSEMGYLQESLADFEACLALEPLYAPCLLDKASTLSGLGRDEEAMAVLLRNLDEGIGRITYIDLSILARRGERALFEAITNDPELLQGWRHHGELYDAYRHPERDHTHLVQDIQRFLESGPSALVGASRVRRASRAPDIIAGLRGSSIRPNFSGFWLEPRSGYLQNELFEAIARDTGLLEYWQTHGFPPRCRAEGAAGFTCD
tara:strand:+ start:35395 stop:37248 length:1854 start_codon:yes stop_codon:yes gene_type:complete